LYTFTEETVTGVPQATGGAVPKGGATSTGIRQQTTVRYTDQGFQPFTVTVKIGTQVTFVNESASGMWVASAVHPTHQLLPGFDQLKSVSRGGSYTYTFEKVGTWQYHNHVTPERTGVIVVTQ
jgi:plastocyanin